MSNYDFVAYTKDNGVMVPATAPITVPGNISSYLKLERAGTTGKLSVYSDAARTVLVNSQTFVIPSTILGLNTASIGTDERFSKDYMLTGSVDNLCIHNGAPLANNNLQINSTKISPNPASNFVNIVSKNIIKNIEIINLNGQIVLAKTCNANNENFNIQNLNAGMFVIKIKTEIGIEFQKLIKE
jgi:hypothetical protein